MDTDFNKYIGIPYSEMNCWQLFQLVQREVYGIELPDVPVPSSDIYKAKQLQFHKELINWKRIETPVDGCGVMLGRKRAATHVGIWHDNMILHTCKFYGSLRTHHKALKKVGLEVIGYYEYHRN